MPPWPAFACPIERQCACRGARPPHLCPRAPFPIVAGIPRFVPATTSRRSFRRTVEAVSPAQLDSYTGVPISRDRLRRCFGEALLEQPSGARRLECGCGAGRSRVCSTAALVTSIDLSERSTRTSSTSRSADASASRRPTSSRSRSQQRLTSSPASASSSTRPPELTIQRLRHVRPGGRLIIDHYTYEVAWYEDRAAVSARSSKRLPTGVAMRFTERMVDAALPLPQARLRIAPALAGLPRVARAHALSDLSAAERRAAAPVGAARHHDSLTDYFTHFRTRGQDPAAARRHGARRDLV